MWGDQFPVDFRIYFAVNYQLTHLICWGAMLGQQFSVDFSLFFEVKLTLNLFCFISTAKTTVVSI